MDGMPDRFEPDADAAFQRTLKAAIGCVGVGLHCGERVALTLRPAEPDSGIIFRRVDLGIDIPARFDAVVDTQLSTVIGLAGDPEARVGTVEHLMAALAAAGVDNAVVELDGPEVPVLDGSAAPFLFLLDCAGIETQDTPRRLIEVLRPVRVEDGEAFAELRPAGAEGGFSLAVSIDFAAPAIGRQALSLPLLAGAFRREVAAARTFALADEVEALRDAGFGRGGSLENAVVVDGAQGAEPRGPAHGGRVRPPQAVGCGGRSRACGGGAARTAGRAPAGPHAQQPAAAGAVRGPGRVAGDRGASRRARAGARRLAGGSGGGVTGSHAGRPRHFATPPEML